MALNCRAGRRQPRQLSGVKRTSQFGRTAAANDPNRTFGRLLPRPLTPQGVNPYDLTVIRGETGALAPAVSYGTRAKARTRQRLRRRRRIRPEVCGLLGDGLDCALLRCQSIINVVGAGAAFIALGVSAQPADANHPYGHHKAEYFSAVFEGALVLAAAVSIFRSAYFGFLTPKPLDAPFIGLAINAGASFINLLWAWFLLMWGRRWRSPALVADGRHVLTDVLTSVGVIVGVALVSMTGWLVLDPAVAVLVGINILWSGYQMVRKGAGGLMDEAPPPEMVDRIKELIGQHAIGAIEAHDVRMRHAGRMTFIEFHLVVPGDTRVAEAHEICDRIETALKDDMEGEALITIHVEPEVKAKLSGVPVL
jgi:cation diffusion facilitator family transporter